MSRTIIKAFPSIPTLEGAGVRLRRAFGHAEAPTFDPFLLLDDFRSGHPEEYEAGFPWHPHRGIETVTYMLEGSVEHGDSLGNRGTIKSGEMQWMTAGRGIIHQEMPKGEKGRMGGLQLWVNLPAEQKMMKPRYRDIQAADIPVIETADGAIVKVLAGRLNDRVGPVKDIFCEPEYLDISVPRNQRFFHNVKRGHTAFAYILEGEGRFGPPPGDILGNGHLVLFSDGEGVSAESSGEPLRFLLISGKPLGEPVAWQGPIVMNTEEELQLAFEEYRNGTFLKD